jgi:hypothetical protein
VRARKFENCVGWIKHVVHSIKSFHELLFSRVGSWGVWG